MFQLQAEKGYNTSIMKGQTLLISKQIMIIVAGRKIINSNMKKYFYLWYKRKYKCFVLLSF